jgi:hypothetical protein
MTITTQASFEQRLATGLDHEQRVQTELEARGWAVSPYGEGVLSDPVRWALQRTESYRRSDPDFYAAHGSTIYGIDAKTAMRGELAAVYRISRRTLADHLRMWAEGEPPIYYVFGNLGVATPAEVLRFHGVDSISQVSGSYVVVDAGRPRPFDEVFGPPALLQAAVRLRPDLPVGIAAARVEADVA